jgi:hypothetical protein
MYLTLIDHVDITINFERPGRTPYLYFVRFNRTANDPLYWLDRDLVRLPLTTTRLDRPPECLLAAVSSGGCGSN